MLKGSVFSVFRVRQLFQTADLSYTLPAHRATVYVMGIALGIGLRYCGRDFRLKKVWLDNVLNAFFAICSTLLALMFSYCEEKYAVINVVALQVKNYFALYSLTYSQ
jgi:hypothetical protein